MIRICFVTTVPLTINAFIRKTAEYLHDKGDFDITYVCDYDKDFEASLPAYVHYHPIAMARGVSLGGIKATGVMADYFKQEQFDIVQFASPNASFYASIAAKKAGIPVRLYCQWGIAYVGFTGLKRSILKCLERTTCHNATVIEPDSHGNVEFSVKEGLYPITKARVIGNGSAAGVDLQKFDCSKKKEYRTAIRKQYGIPEQDLVYGFVGRLDKDKGVNELLTAYRTVKNDHTHLLMVGPKDKELTLDQELYQWSKNEPSVIYTGGVSIVEQYLAAMDLFILPSYREGFGSSVIEAEAMGLPVIVTNIPGPTEAMEDGKTGIVIQKADVSSLQAAMEKLAGNESLRMQYGTAGHLFADTHFEQNALFEQIYLDRKALVSGK